MFKGNESQRSGIFKLCLGGMLLGLSLGAGAQAQDGGKDGVNSKAPGMRDPLNHLEDAKKSSADLPPELKSIIIDKPRIAAESTKRAIGLREAGNPHIPSGLLLSHIQDNPAVSRVSQEELRQEQIKRIERREPSPQAARPSPPAGSAPDAGSPATERAGKERLAPAPDGGSLGLAVLVGGLLLGALGTVLYLKRK